MPGAEVIVSLGKQSKAHAYAHRKGRKRFSSTHTHTKREGNGFPSLQGLEAQPGGSCWAAAGDEPRYAGMGTSCPAPAPLWWQQDGHHHAAQGPGLVGVCFSSFQGGFGWAKAGKGTERPN